MYNVGDCVVYPMYGAGVIDSIEQKEILGENKRYYILKFTSSGMKVMVPVENRQEVGLRDVISKREYTHVLEYLARASADDGTNWNRRYRMNLEHMRTGNIYEVADVVRSLSCRDRQRGLSTGERKMLGVARGIMMSELVLSSGRDGEDVEKEVDDALLKSPLDIAEEG